jgi:hypothetical protein
LATEERLERLMNNLPKIMLTCPLCRQPNFLPSGLRAHVCKAPVAQGLPKRRLTREELHAAQDLAGDPSWKKLNPGKPQA